MFCILQVRGTAIRSHLPISISCIWDARRDALASVLHGVTADRDYRSGPGIVQGPASKDVGPQ
jgi:hypothetical protein